MTEAEWLAATDPTPMLEFLKGKASDRRLRLFACACCRRIWHLLPNRLLRKSIEQMERFVDGEIGKCRLWWALSRAWDVGADVPARKWTWPLCVVVDAGAYFEKPIKQSLRVSQGAIWAEILEEMGCLTRNPKTPELVIEERHSKPYADVLRDILGNLFCPLTMNSSWLTPTVLALATSIYKEKVFERMPSLADALQDAGCDNENILNHLRGPGPHAKGCWCVDLVLGKT